MRAFTVSAGILRFPWMLISEITSVCAQLAEAESTTSNIPSAHPSHFILRQNHADEEDEG
jgi:hypothetical protein